MLKLLIVIALIVNQALGIGNSPVLNEEKTETIDGSEEISYQMQKDNSYIFEIKNENYLYSFASDIDEIFYVKNGEEDYVLMKNASFYGNGEKVYINQSSAISENIKIKISPVPLYTKLNSFQTLNENQNFFIKSEEKSMAYFGSFDRNSKTYISEISEEKTLNENYTRINDKFHTIEADKLYHIKNEVYNISVFNKYVYPLDLTQTQIEINDEINFLYLEKRAESYTLDFAQNTLKRILKLSKKTLNSKVKITKGDEQTAKELDEKSQYYSFEEGAFTGKLELKIEENDAFIEFLSNEGDSEILKDISKENYSTNNNLIIIKIDKTQKSFELNLKSDKSFNYSLSLGLTNQEGYYYSSKLNTKINSEKKEETFTYLALFKGLDLLENEFLSLTINFEKEEAQNINISYKQYSLIDELLDEEVPEEKAKNILKYLQAAIDLYIYKDIAKNPPEFPEFPNYHHRKVDLKDEIGKISTKNRKYYEFYQEIEKILMTTRDLHFLIGSHKTEGGIQFSQYIAVLPFRFYIKKYGEKQEPRIFISKRDQIDLFDENVQKFVAEHLDIPIKTINDLDPFDYIQNWGQYRGCKSQHCQFVYMMSTVTGFYIDFFPLDHSDLTLNEYEFEDNSILRIPYYISKPNPKESEEYNSYFLKTIKKYNKYSIEIPTPDEIKEKYLISKGLKKKPKVNKAQDEKIQWDISYIDEDSNYFKCRVDKEKEVNVFVQNSFSIDPYETAGKFLDCVQLFHSNGYPLIIIETRNGGGYPYISLLLIQLFQMRSFERTFSSFGTSEESKKYYELYEWGVLSADTCEEKSIADLENITDFYDYNDLNVSHTRTVPTISILDNNARQALNDFRKDFENSENLKRPTDIMIYTDGFSYSATSTFIKGFQHIGGAITVGYYGNPKINGTDVFDASQADSGIIDFEGSDTYKKLNELGWTIYGITIEEVFDGTIIDGKEYPREYTIIPVDYRVDIYSDYSDGIYDEFISEGKKIFNSVNNEKTCNPKNDRLLMHSDNCKNIAEHLHGGYKCSDEGYWDETTCIPYYCDIGYSFDKENNKCDPDCISDISELKYIYQSNYKNEFTADHQTSYGFLAIRYPTKYVFQTSGDYMENLPRFSLIQAYDEVYINKDKKAEQDFSVKIFEVETDFRFLNYKGKVFLYENYILAEHRQLLLLQFESEHVLYLNNILKLEPNKLKYLKYRDGISYKDILDLNEQYFEEFKGDFFHMEKNELYIINFDYNTDYALNPIYYSISPIENEKLSFEEGGSDYLYLQKNKNYEIYIGLFDIEGVLKLSELSLNSEIIIDDELILNKANKYHKFQAYDKTLKIKTEKEDVLIEFMWNLSNYYNSFEVLDLKKSEYNLTSEINVIEIPRKKEYKNITFEVKGENAIYNIHQEKSIHNFYHNLHLDLENLIPLNNFSFSVIEPYKDLDQLMEDEYHNVIISRIVGTLNIKINIEMSNDKKDDKKGLQTWHIVLIIVGSLLVIILIVVIIILVKRKNKELSSEKIEEKMESLTSI